MNPKEFHERLNQTLLTPEEKNKAWIYYKTKDAGEAVAYVENIEHTFSAHRKNLQLKDLPVSYKIWGASSIDHETIDQMANAACLPVAVSGALMPDAHLGYGLPIGGVLATDNAVIPYAVGVDIACRMMLTVYSVPSTILKNSQSNDYKQLHSTLLKHTIFGSGARGIHEGNIEHPLLEKEKWQHTHLIRSLRQTAIHQIGTSGGGNHFVEWGELEIIHKQNPLNLSPGSYLALLSHSGSRGVGYKIAHYYTNIAMSRMTELDHAVRHLAWLSLDQDIGKEYWEAMQLAGEFASANHHVIHQRLGQALGITPIATVENHHNFAWREKILINGIEKNAVVHRKGATPAAKGVLGIIPGTMADPGYLVIGKGNADSLNSASHGSGRQMARTKAKKTISHEEHRAYLSKNCIDLIGGGLDEAPQAYKPIHTVMEAQKDLVDIIGKFQPKIVRMADEEILNISTQLPEGIIDDE